MSLDFQERFWSKVARAAVDACWPWTAATEDQVKDIRRRYVPRKVTLHQLAAEHGVSYTTIHRALHDGWRHVDVS